MLFKARFHHKAIAILPYSASFVFSPIQVNPLHLAFRLIAALIEEGAELSIGYGILIYKKCLTQARYLDVILFTHNKLPWRDVNHVLGNLDALRWLNPFIDRGVYEFRNKEGRFIRDIYLLSLIFRYLPGKFSGNKVFDKGAVRKSIVTLGIIPVEKGTVAYLIVKVIEG